MIPDDHLSGIFSFAAGVEPARATRYMATHARSLIMRDFAFSEAAFAARRV